MALSLIMRLQHAVQYSDCQNPHVKTSLNKLKIVDSEQVVNIAMSDNILLQQESY